MSVAEEGFLQGFGVGGPASLHIAQHRPEVRPVIPHCVVLGLECCG